MTKSVAFCRGMARAERRRALRTDRWWQEANARSLTFRQKIAMRAQMVLALVNKKRQGYGWVK